MVRKEKGLNMQKLTHEQRKHSTLQVGQDPYNPPNANTARTLLTPEDQDYQIEHSTPYNIEILNVKLIHTLEEVELDLFFNEDQANQDLLHIEQIEQQEGLQF